MAIAMKADGSKKEDDSEAYNACAVRVRTLSVGITNKRDTQVTDDDFIAGAKNCVVIMCSSVHPRELFWCQVGAIDTFIVRIDELKSHSWETSTFISSANFIRHKPDLSDDVQITELTSHSCRFVARTFNPLPGAAVDQRGFQ